MQDLTSVVLAVAALFLAGLRADAWSGAGHQVIAAEAYRALSPALQKKVVQVLAAHPRYAAWKEAASGDTRSDEFGIEIFMRASTWADEIRRHESQYNHPRWHFIDYPLTPPKFPLLPDASPDDDVLYAIQRCEQTLSGRKASPEERAVYLAWLIHLIGDLHQPLHCASLFDAGHPKGDKGGNDFFVKPGERGITLHAFWDELLGTSGKPRAHLNYAIAIQADHPRKSLKRLKKARTPKDWSLESRSVAIESVYLRGKLQGGLDPQDAPDLPAGYAQAAKAAAETQAALAGYRLADEISKWVR